jgi:diguanylate cyclase (GGDEF)-like protein/PAS domain S-box-containing protein
MSPASPGPQPGGPAPAATLRQVLDGLHQGVVLRDGQGTIVDVNPAAEQILCRTRAELIGRRTITDGDGVHPDGTTLPRKQSASSVALATGRDVVGQLFGMTMPDGELRFISVNARALREGDVITGVVSTFVDVTEQQQVVAALAESEKRFRLSEERFRNAFDQAPIGKALVSTEGRFTRVNTALCRITGYTESDLLGTTFQALTHPDDLDADLDQLQRLLAGESESYEMEKRYRHADGHYIWALLSVSLVRGEAGAPLYFVSQIQDISEQKLAAERLTQLSLRDPLTGLANRVLFADRLAHAVERARRSKERIAVLFIDFDRFKAVNDTLGHAAGDELLRQAAVRMRRAVRPADTIARLGGDEFTVLCEDLGGSDDAGWVAHRLSEELERPFDLFGKRCGIGVSIGIAVADPQDSAEAVLARADASMYRSKDDRRDWRGAA